MVQATAKLSACEDKAVDEVRRLAIVAFKHLKEHKQKPATRLAPMIGEQLLRMHREMFNTIQMAESKINRVYETIDKEGLVRWKAFDTWLAKVPATLQNSLNRLNDQIKLISD